ncbi:hypothetical protein BDQ17DRAFT_1347022 [Cyathus striatus]|nr:hypothetical protein BDQ17DRAFT_1347022 [Cyathus striatus]
MDLNTLLIRTNVNVHVNYGAIFVGSSLSFFLYGITCCQASSYFSSRPRDNIWMKSLLETISACLLGPALWHYLMRRGLDSRNSAVFYSCSDWFGWGKMRIRCQPGLSANTPWLYATYTLRIISDGIIVGMMCHQLYTRRSQASQFSNTLRLIRTLIVWTFASGLLMWFVALPFLSMQNLYANTMLALFVFVFYTRLTKRFRQIANETITMETMMQGQTSSFDLDQENPVHSHPAELNNSSIDIVDSTASVHG